MKENMSCIHNIFAENQTQTLRYTTDTHSKHSRLSTVLSFSWPFSSSKVVTRVHISDTCIYSHGLPCKTLRKIIFQYNLLDRREEVSERKNVKQSVSHSNQKHFCNLLSFLCLFVLLETHSLSTSLFLYLFFFHFHKNFTCVLLSFYASKSRHTTALSILDCILVSENVNYVQREGW